MASELRALPSVEILLQTPALQALIEAYGRPLTVTAVRAVLAEVRAASSSLQSSQTLPDQAALAERIAQTLSGWAAPTLLPVINASGVLLHTNLGRAPLSRAAVQAIAETAQGYSNLEFDLDAGRRGSRLLHCEALLTRLTGAEAGLVVNNNAAALLLALSALARRRKVVIARTQLVEIGGGFRVPEVMQQSGARLLEVGATNRVHLADYQAALEEQPALLLHAHRSNFQIVGFTGEPTLAELGALAAEHGLPLVDDQGSGALLDTARYGLAHEPTVQESLAAGSALVCFSGDKLLGGPQAGIIVGRRELVAKLKKHPLARAVRADKLALAALSATLQHYLRDQAEREIPLWRMISAPASELCRRALSWSEQLGQGEVIAGQSTVGGGSLPGETLPTHLLALQVRSPDRTVARLRRGAPPVVARLEAGHVLLDPRSVLPEEDERLVAAIRAAL